MSEKIDWEEYEEKKAEEFERHKNALNDLYREYILSKLGKVAPLNIENFKSKECDYDSMRKAKLEDSDESVYCDGD